MSCRKIRVLCSHKKRRKQNIVMKICICFSTKLLYYTVAALCMYVCMIVCIKSNRLYMFTIVFRAGGLYYQINLSLSLSLSLSKSISIDSPRSYLYIP